MHHGRFERRHPHSVPARRPDARPDRSRHAAARGIGAGLIALALVLTAACTGGADGPDASAGVSQAQVTVTPAEGERVPADAAVRVTTSEGNLEAVEVVSRNGARAAGTISADGRSWVADDGKLLAFGARYTVTADVVDDAGRASTTTSTFRVRESKRMKAFVSPANGRKVGVGMPVIAKLSATPQDRAQVERLMTVEASKPVTGAWSWFSDTELHWRPREFWPANTKVTVTAALDGVKFGKNVYGSHTTVARFRTGDAMISTVDVANHEMTVTRNGKTIKTIPVTTGDSSFPTRSGIKVFVTRERTRVMDSSTVDIPAGSPDAYRIKVEYAMRLTWSGEFVHAAPWSVRSQGNANVSHGCTGMSTANAKWMYDNSRIGDVVKYINSSRPMEQGNGYTDWNVPWKEWLKGSALSA
jgi:lipoprotein-anchoring transpeptidase ErfK/SrfK